MPDDLRSSGTVDPPDAARLLPTIAVARPGALRISARSHYAVRIMTQLALAGTGTLVKADRIATAERIPRHFLDNIIGELRHAGLVVTQRGSDGGTTLARPADEITLADILESSSSGKRLGERPTLARRADADDDVWTSVQLALQQLLCVVTLCDVAAGTIPPVVARVLCDRTPDAPLMP